MLCENPAEELATRTMFEINKLFMGLRASLFVLLKLYCAFFACFFMCICYRICFVSQTKPYHSDKFTLK